MMSIKTILVPTENHNAMQSALETALLLARRCDSYIEGFALCWAINEFIGGDIVGGIPLERYKRDIADEAKKARQIFESFMQKHNVPRSTETTASLSFSWLDDAPEGESFVGSYGRVFDVIVMSRPDAKSSPLHDRAIESGLFESGRPILLTPPSPSRQIATNAFIVTAWDSPVVQLLIDAKGIELASVPRADAYIAHYPFLNKLVLPAGVSDLLNNRPPTDVVMLAPKGSLAVRADLHPAIQHLLLSAAVQIHSQPGIFQKAGQFPAAESIDIPLSEEAQRFYKTGRPFLQNHLPFWIATLVERVLVVFVPLAALLLPMSKFLPQTYDWFMRSKIMRLYEEMRLIESEMEAQGHGHDASFINAKLDQLDQRANRLRLPTTYASMLYGLRSHIDLIRGRLARSPDRKPH